MQSVVSTSGRIACLLDQFEKVSRSELVSGSADLFDAIELGKEGIVSFDLAEHLTVGPVIHLNLTLGNAIAVRALDEATAKFEALPVMVSASV